MVKTLTVIILGSCLLGNSAYANTILIQNGKTSETVKAEISASCVDNCMDGIIRARPMCEAKCANKRK